MDEATHDEWSPLVAASSGGSGFGRHASGHLELLPEHWMIRREPHQRLAPKTTSLPQRFFPYSWMRYRVNVLLLLVPPGLAGSRLNLSPSFIFWSNFFGIFPLGILLGRFTEHISWYSTAALGALLNATFGNAVEFIFAVSALRHRLTDVLKATMLGSIIGNELFVTGFCFLVGGLHFREQTFAPTFSDTNMSILHITTIGILFPSVFRQAVDAHRRQAVANETASNATSIVNNASSRDVYVSRCTSVLLLALYVAYLVFELVTHAEAVEAPGSRSSPLSASASALGFLGAEQALERRDAGAGDGVDAQRLECSAGTQCDESDMISVSAGVLHEMERGQSMDTSSFPDDAYANTRYGDADVRRMRSLQNNNAADAQVGAGNPAGQAARSTRPQPCTAEQATLTEVPDLSLWANIVLLLLCTLLISFCTDALVGSLEQAAAALSLPPPFVSFILLPLVGNIAEHLGAVSMAMQNKMDLAVRIAVGSAVQVGLLVFPALVLVAWILGIPLTLEIPLFGGFALIASTVVLANAMRDSTSNWLEGIELLAVYFIICVCYYFTS
jgi:Ca2+:H+ antiporter